MSLWCIYDIVFVIMVRLRFCSLGFVCVVVMAYVWCMYGAFIVYWLSIYCVLMCICGSASSVCVRFVSMVQMLCICCVRYGVFKMCL